VKHILAAIALVAFAQQAHAQTCIADAAFDPACKGTLVVTRTQDQAETRKLCPTAAFTQPLAIGCTIINVAGCWVIISPDDVIALAGLTLEFVKRHETAHCNGWPADHRGHANPPANPFYRPKAAALVDSADLPLAGIPHEVGIILAGARTKAGRAEFEGHQEWASN
jgi:hypothetical protein